MRFHPRAKPATILQPWARLGRRLRTRDELHLAGATRQDENNAIAIAEDRFDRAPIGKKSQVGLRCGRGRDTGRPIAAAQSARRCHTGRTLSSSDTNGAQEPASRVGVVYLFVWKGTLECCAAGLLRVPTR
jgi:hypothetical protein